MLIYNTYTREKEEFKPIEENKVKMYICGPTVYNYIHIGNARPVLFFDLVHRYFKYLGYEVEFVSNVTDVDDKIINRAIEEEVTEAEIAEKYLNYFLECNQLLNALPFTSMPKVTENMDEMIQFSVDLLMRLMEMCTSVLIKYVSMVNYQERKLKSQKLELVSQKILKKRTHQTLCYGKKLIKESHGIRLGVRDAQVGIRNVWL